MDDQLSRKGYERIFVHDQNPNIQREALRRAGCDFPNGMQGYGSEPLAAPYARKQLLDFLTRGDQLYVYRLDRLSRDEHTLTNLLQQLDAKGIELIVLVDRKADSDE